MFFKEYWEKTNLLKKTKINHYQVNMKILISTKNNIYFFK